jgi:anti-sigma B factor antagonist
MDTHLEQVGDVTVVEILADAVDTNNSADLKAALTEAATAHKRVLVDLGQVKFIDSAGCGAIIAALPKARAAGADLKLCNLTPQVLSLFELFMM